LENPRPEKVAVVEDVRSRLESASAAILTEYRGLKVKDLAVLRRSLTDAGGEYKIYKNTLVRFAVRDLGLTELEPMLEGPTAITFVDGDAAAVAKALRDYARGNPLLVVKGGLLGKKVVDAAAAAALADLPSRETLLARLAGAMAAPMQQFAGLLQALPRNFAYGLKALIDQGGAPGAPASAPAESTAEAPATETPATETPATETPATEVEAEEPGAPQDTGGPDVVTPAPDGPPPEGTEAAAETADAPQAQIPDITETDTTPSETENQE
jgi:large subunit ribosomal protein L10